VPGAPIVNAVNAPAANISACVPTTNIPSFGQCKSLINPKNFSYAQTKVYAACEPTVPAPWTPGCSATKINGQPALNSSCTCTCTLGLGTISITASKATNVNVG